jgi:hypothetical protein
MVVLFHPTKKHFRDAANLVVANGLCKGVYETPAGRHCMSGALLTMAGGRPFSLNYSLENFLVKFNDAHGRTADEVASALLFFAERPDEFY